MFLRRLRVLLAGLTALLLLLPLQPAAAVTAQQRQGEPGSGASKFPLVLAARTAGRSTSISWSDLGDDDAWAAVAIDYVAGTKGWMRDFAPNPDGTYPFRPDMIQTRKYFARALVRAFAPTQLADPGTVIPDLETTSPFYRWVAVAVDKGWMGLGPGGRFNPDKPVTTLAVHRALVLALGMKSTARELNQLHSRDGAPFQTPRSFGTTLLGMRLGLRYNNKADESQDVAPTIPLARKQVAYSLWRASTLEQWVVPYVAEQYRGIELPKMGPSRRAIVDWGLRYVGYPYVWAGEWGFASPEPAALGGQPVPGFDCSGITWWVMRKDDGAAWEISPPRPYEGWRLPERSSAAMAAGTTERLKHTDLRPGDLMFYDGNSDGIVDHVNVYVGRGYALDSSSGTAGVTLMYVGPGYWYGDNFKFGRRILPG